MEYDSCNNAIQWKISASIKVIAHILTLGLIVSEILMFKNVDLENVCQGHRVQNTRFFDCKYENLSKSFNIFVLALTIYEIITFQIF